MNTEHNFLLTLKMDGKTIATRNITVNEFNENVIYSLKLNDLMKNMCSMVENQLRDNSIDESHRLIERWER